MELTERHLKAWAKFAADIEAFAAETGQEYATLYEDAYTTREVKGFNMTQAGELTWWEYETYRISNQQRQEREQMVNEEDAREWLAFWRANLRRAKRYWAMDTERLDAIQDGQINDEED